MKNNWKKKANQKVFRAEKVMKRKDVLFNKWNSYDNSFHSWIDKKRHNTNELIFSKTEIVRKEVKVKLDLSNYATKVDLKK